jgi:hypothetical protein
MNPEYREEVFEKYIHAWKNNEGENFISPRDVEKYTLPEAIKAAMEEYKNKPTPTPVDEINFEQVYDGEWIEPLPQTGHKMKCCDCGLTHTINFRVENGKVQFQAFRETTITGQHLDGK